MPSECFHVCEADATPRHWRLCRERTTSFRLAQATRRPDQAVILTEKMSASAAPRIVLGAGDEAGADWVELDISCGGECVSVVHDVRSEAALPEVAAPALAPVITVVYRRCASPMAPRRPSDDAGTAMRWTWFGMRQ